MNEKLCDEKIYTYKRNEYFCSAWLSGLWSVLIPGFGYLKADSFGELKKLIRYTHNKELA